MGSYPWWHRALDWLTFLPAVVGFRLIWLTAKLGNREAKDVHRAMWDAGLNIPPLSRAGKQSADDRGEQR